MDSSRNQCDALKLLSVKRLIEECLRTHKEDLILLQDSRQVNVQDLLKESLQIQFNCHAPKEYTIGMPLFKSHPPAPQPEEMRVGALPTYNKTVGKNDTTKSLQTAVDTETSTFLNALKAELSAKRNRVPVEQSHVIEMVNNEDEFGDNGASGGEVMQAEDNISLKKARTANISFGMSDSEDSDEE
mmetsp:Transcript_54596/g.95454  ORF Transcript_54596/g.95454 Transcript_54596/m.95454 type:complete len:186 (-) Transcript_54596:116-673(-)|eukprot:CAMPEP_0184971066 /NCGR_PEP_ID=MMETSP1098-20130426/3357_1 /TAXON_ID=89044 /ORGANISM="Spumella elongata, Strain CCAP 955/1" /LENGTH=185 /DNA_ID=CAMNT_0027493101 /DNA_START=96 /DNA_END=653 /DNA_ORIENTATION=-